MRIFLHIGTHKTASTSIQAWLKSSQTHLANHQIIALPSPPFSRSREIMEAESLAPDLVAECRTELTHLIARHSPSPDHTLVLSSEGFSGSLRRGYSNAPICANILAQILADHSVTVVAYLRSQDSFIESLYTQHIHQGESTPFADYLATLPPQAFDWHAHLQSFAAAFGSASLRVRPYHNSQLPEPDAILRDFCQILGCPFAPASHGPTLKNVGYSRDATELALLVNPSLNSTDRQTLRKLLQRSASKGTWNAYSYFTPNQRAAILNQYAQSNELVAQHFLGGSWPAFFPTTPPAPSYQGLTLTSVTLILVKLLLELHRQHHLQIHAIQNDHQTQLNTLREQLNHSRHQLTSLKQKAQPLLKHRRHLSLLGQSRLLRRLCKWEQTLRRLCDRNP
jgi:hypothetical protein